MCFLLAYGELQLAVHPLEKTKVRVYEEFGMWMGFVRLHVNEAALRLVK